MSSIRKPGITALSAAIALSLGAIPVAFIAPALLAAGTTQTIAPASSAAGDLELSTTASQGLVTWDVMTQAFTGGQQCKITPGSSSASASLLDITGSVGGAPGSAGFKNGSIGVFEFTADGQGPANASQCFRVDADSFTPSETLTLNLGAGLTDTFGALVGDSTTTRPARIRLIAQSQSGTVQVTRLGVGAAPDAVDQTKAWTKLKSGAAINLTLGVGQFEGVALKATAGSFSLTNATFPLLSQADQTFCNPGNTTPGADNTRTEDNTTVTYLGNVSQSQTCFGVKLVSGDEEVSFIKPRTVAPDAQFLLDTTWTVDNVDELPSIALRDTEIDFEIPAPDPLDFQPLEFCSTFPSSVLGRDSNGNLKILDWGAFIDPAEANPFEDFDADSTDKEFACIDTRTSEVTATEVKVHDLIFAVGDLKNRY